MDTFEITAEPPCSANCMLMPFDAAPAPRRPHLLSENILPPHATIGAVAARIMQEAATAPDPQLAVRLRELAASLRCAEAAVKQALGLTYRDAFTYPA